MLCKIGCDGFHDRRDIWSPADNLGDCSSANGQASIKTGKTFAARLCEL
jgi:hypothetical protein